MVLPGAIFALLICASCVATVGPYGTSYAIPPPLPAVVVLDDSPYFVHDGHHYYYNSNHWYYSNYRSGPWRDLPRNHYPKELRYRGQHHYWH